METCFCSPGARLTGRAGTVSQGAGTPVTERVKLSALAALVQDHHRQAQALARLDADLGGIQEQADRFSGRAGGRLGRGRQLERSGAR